MMTREKQDKLDRLAEILKGTNPAKLESALMKGETIQMRVTRTDKVDMQRLAKACGLTLTEYLTRLHYFAAERLDQKK